jgi:hypothetical protein
VKYLSSTEPYWEGETWRKAARWYHVNRQGRTLLVEFDPRELQQLDSLLSNNISLDAAYRELNAPKTGPRRKSPLKPFGIPCASAGSRRSTSPRHASDLRAAMRQHSHKSTNELPG